MVNAFDLPPDIIPTPCRVASNSQRVLPEAFRVNPDLLIHSALRSRVQVSRHELPAHSAIKFGDDGQSRGTGGVRMVKARGSRTFQPKVA